MNPEQADRIIALLERIAEQTAANAVISEQIRCELAAPRLQREHLEAQQKAWRTEEQNEIERRKVQAELQETETRRRLPRLFASGAGIPSIRSESGGGT